MLKEIPQWLESFRLTVVTESETMLFDSLTDDIQKMKFDDTLGGQKGTYIKIDQRLYKIEAVQVYTNMATDISDKLNEKFSFQITIVIS
jgi:hypothetical protein